MKHYKGFEGKNQQENDDFRDEFERLKSVAMELKPDEKLGWADFRKFKRDLEILFRMSLIDF